MHGPNGLEFHSSYFRTSLLPWLFEEGGGSCRCALVDAKSRVKLCNFFHVNHIEIETCSME